MSASLPLISIVTLNFNQTRVTCEFLESLKRDLTYPNTEVIVVDNHSTEDPSDAVLAAYPDARMIRNQENLGFAAGNNVGIRQAKGDYIFIVNNDTEVTPYLLERLLEVFKQYPKAGIVCPRFQFFYDKGVLEYAGYRPINIYTGRNSMIGAHEKDEGQYHEVAETHYAHGGAMLVSREVIGNAGEMPEEYFLYYEELDWSEIVKRAGFKIYVQPAALIYHKESVSTGKNSPLKTFYLTRNRILFMRRNHSKRDFFVFGSYFFLFTLPWNTLKFMVEGKKEHLRSFWKGVCWHFNRNVRYS